MAYLSSVPGAAQTFGPGVGGGLAALALNAPVLVDGVISLVIVILVYFYLRESPAWLQKQAELENARKESSSKAPATEGTTPIPWMAINWLGMSNFFFSLGMFSCVSML